MKSKMFLWFFLAFFAVWTCRANELLLREESLIKHGLLAPNINRYENVTKYEFKSKGDAYASISICDYSSAEEAKRIFPERAISAVQWAKLPFAVEADEAAFSSSQKDWSLVARIGKVIVIVAGSNLPHDIAPQLLSLAKNQLLEKIKPAAQ